MGRPAWAGVRLAGLLMLRGRRGDQRGGRPPWLGLPALVHSHVACRSDKPGEPLIHDDKRSIPPARSRYSNMGGRTKERPGKIRRFPFPIHACPRASLSADSPRPAPSMADPPTPARTKSRTRLVWGGNGGKRRGDQGNERLSRHTARAETMRPRHPCQVLQAGATHESACVGCHVAHWLSKRMHHFALGRIALA